MEAPYRRAEALFQQVIDLPFGQRTGVLAAACGDDAAVLRQVRALLSAAENADVVLEHGPFAGIAGAMEKCGDRVGAYTLLEPLGEGGFGTVWRAQQAEPVRREVALKIVKPGMDTREVLARFAAERQALALMEHPHIARVFDAGATATGRPYFVMELVRGAPVTAFCDAHRLPIGARLALFLQVCRAVEHAHQKGVIHRDLKPTNLLAAEHDGVAAVKVIDFGIAKAIAQPLTEHTVSTGPGQALGTPLYMAPEQLVPDARDIDTRADIYALGVLLFDLLTGLLPFASARSGAAALEEMRRRICTEEPPRPSQVLARLPHSARDELAGLRGADRHSLAHALRGDLDWIVLRCLEKDRDRRYATARDLALDVQRHLAHEPVAAAAPTLRYTAGKFLRRHKAALAVAASLAALLVAGTAISTREAFRARRAELRAETLLAQVKEESAARQAAAEARQDALRAKEVALKAAQAATRRAVDGERQAREAEADTKAFGDWLVRRVLAAAQSREVAFGLGIQVTVVQALEAAEKFLEQDFAGRPLAEARTRHAIADTWGNLGRYAAAAPHLRKAAEHLERALGADAPETLSARNCLGRVLHHLGRAEEAIALLEPLVQMQEIASGPVPYDLRSPAENLLAAYQSAGRRDQALALAQRTAQKRGPGRGSDDDETLANMDRLVRAHREAGAWGEAITLAQRALTLRQRVLEPDHADTFSSMLTLGLCCLEGGKPAQAVPLFEQVLAHRQSTLDALHPETLQVAAQLAAALTAAGQLHRAIALYEETLPRCKEVFGLERADTLAFMQQYAAAALARGDAARAVSLSEEVLAIRTRQSGPGHADTVRAQLDLAAACAGAGHFDRAIALQHTVLALRRRSAGQEHPDTIQSMHLLAGAYTAAARYHDALPLYTQAIALRRRLLGPEHAATLASLHDLGCLYCRRGDFTRALPLLEQTLAARRRVLGPEAAETIATLCQVGETLCALRRFDSAIPLLERALAARRTHLGAESAETVQTLRRLAEACDGAGQHEKALLRREELLALLEKNLGPAADETLANLALLAARYTKHQQFDQAVRLHETAATRRIARLGADHAATLQSLHDLAVACDAAGDLKRARQLFEQAFARRKSTLGYHAETVVSADRLGHCLLRSGAPAAAVPVFQNGLAIARHVATGGEDRAVALLAHHLAATLLCLERVREALPLAREANTAYRGHPVWSATEARHAQEVFQSAVSAWTHLWTRTRNPSTPPQPIKRCWDWAPAP